MAQQKPKTRRLLLYRPGAKGINDAVLDQLRAAFPGFTLAELRHHQDFRELVTERATIVVAGGDGTVGHACRVLAGSAHRLAILPLGTFNNFARSLDIPERLEDAIKVARAGRTRAVTLGLAADRFFLEVAAIGAFGGAIALGERAKEGEFGNLARDLRALAGAKPFEYDITGDFEAHGHARSLVFANTRTTGNQIGLVASDPVRPYLELPVDVGRSRLDLVGRAVAAAVLDRHEEDMGMTLRFRRLTIDTRPRVQVYADNKRLGRTPVQIQARPRALRVAVP